MSLSTGLAVTCDTFSPGGRARVQGDGWTHSATTPPASAQRWGSVPATRSAVRSQSRGQAQHKGRGSELRPSRGGRCAPGIDPGGRGELGVLMCLGCAALARLAVHQWPEDTQHLTTSVPVLMRLLPPGMPS